MSPPLGRVTDVTLAAESVLASVESGKVVFARLTDVDLTVM